VQVAFYGGSFTALPFNTQRTYLEKVRPFILSRQVESIRLSTRPDSITREVLALLREYHVATVELGAQTMNDKALKSSGRGHTSLDTIHAVDLLKEHGFDVGLQLMPGLPGDSNAGFIDTVEKIIGLKPGFVRIYPAVVIKDTPLEKLYASGGYAPLPLDDAVRLCREALEMFEQAGIDVIRIGLQPTDELNKPGTVLAGPYHPAFRQLVESSIIVDRMRSALRNRAGKTGEVIFRINPKDLSAAIGQRRCNIALLKNEFGLRELRIVTGTNALARRSPIFL
jgi:histone acetyltransferase (RNA polymerase elongator complex component)